MFFSHIHSSIESKPSLCHTQASGQASTSIHSAKPSPCTALLLCCHFPSTLSEKLAIHTRRLVTAAAAAAAAAAALAFEELPSSHPVTMVTPPPGTRLFFAIISSGLAPSTSLLFSSLLFSSLLLSSLLLSLSLAVADHTASCSR